MISKCEYPFCLSGSRYADSDHSFHALKNKYGASASCDFLYNSSKNSRFSSRVVSVNIFARLAYLAVLSHSKNALSNICKGY